jgi:mannose-1-phosphate guanylyltransferase
VSGEFFARDVPSRLDFWERYGVFDAMVLAAGLGTRLRPLTDELPKPLLPVGQTPLLGAILDVLREGGAREVVVNTHHLSGKIAAFLGGYDHRIHVSHEPVVLGTAGGIAQARRWLGERPLVLVNGDILGEVPLQALLGAPATGLVLAVRPRPVGQGTVGLGAEGQVVRLRGERFGVEQQGGDYTGMARLDPEALRALPAEGCLVGDYALPLLRRGGAVRSARVEADFLDIGTPRSFLEANLAWLAGTGGPALGRGARVADTVTLSAAVVGAGAEVTGQGALERVVVLPGARARAPLADAVVLPSGRVVAVS